MSLQAIELDFPEAIIEYPLAESDGAQLFWKLVYDLIPLCDILTEKGVAIAATFDKQVSCRAGCGVCCQQMVPLSPPEAALIADVVSNFPEQRKIEVQNKFSDAVDRLTEAELLEPLLATYRKGADAETVRELNRRYFALSIYCPFLVDGSCSIYPWRPSRCREYSVLSPSDLCSDPFDPGIRQLPLTIKMCESFSIEWSTLMNRPPEIIPLVYALEWVESNPSTASLEIPEKDVEKVKRRILERVCSRANEIARERMKTP